MAVCCASPDRLCCVFCHTVWYLDCQNILQRSGWRAVCVTLVQYIRNISESYEKKLKWSRLIWQVFLCIAFLSLAAAILWLVLFEPYIPNDIDLFHGGVTNDVILLHAISTLTLLPGIMLVRAVNISLRA